MSEAGIVLASTEVDVVVVNALDPVLAPVVEAELVEIEGLGRRRAGQGKEEHHGSEQKNSRLHSRLLSRRSQADRERVGSIPRHERFPAFLAGTPGFYGLGFILVQVT
jgi:hypothetical protein